MTAESKGPPPGWEVPLCKPMTRRVMFLGLPYFVMAALGVSAMQMINLGLYPMLVLVPIAYAILRALYARDEWGLSVWLENASSATRGKNKLEV